MHVYIKKRYKNDKPADSMIRVIKVDRIWSILFIYTVIITMMNASKEVDNISNFSRRNFDRRVDK